MTSAPLLPPLLSPLTRLSPPVLATLFVILASLIFFWRLGQGPIYRTMEGREALVMQEIVRTGNWILPLRNGETIPSKPPLLHWIGAGVAQLSGGMSEWAARFPCALFSALSIGLTCFLGCRLANREVGILASLLLLTTPLFVEMAREAWVDSALAFFVLAAVTSFVFMYEADEWRGWRSVAFALSLAGATLSKGPIGYILPGLIILLYVLIQGQLSRLWNLLSVSNIVLAVGIPVVWYLLALNQEGWTFFQKQVLQENVVRFTSGSGKRIPSSAFFFLPFVLNGLPWSLVFGFGVWHFSRQAPIREKGVLALLWCFTIIAFFSIAAGKRDVYMLPLYPAMALFAVEWGWANIPYQTRPLSAFLRIPLLLITVGLSILALLGALSVAQGYITVDSESVDLLFGRKKWNGAALYIRFVSEQPLYALAVMSLVCGCGVWAAWAATAGRLRTALWFVLCVLLISTAGIYPFTRAYSKEFKNLTGFAGQITQTLGPEEPLFFYTPEPYSSEFDEFSQVYFYLNRHVPLAPCAQQADLSRCPPGYYILRTRHWQQLEQTQETQLVLDSRTSAAPGARPHLVLIRRD